MILYQATNTVVEICEEVIIYTAQNIVPYREWEESFTIGVNFLTDHWNRNFKWLNNLEKLKAIGPEHLVFLQNSVNSKAFKLYPPVKVAFVEPTSFTGKACMYSYIFNTNLRLDKHINLAVCKSINEASEWLQNNTQASNIFEKLIKEKTDRITKSFSYQQKQLAA